MTRAAIYARYSTDKQNERSAEDQARVCHERADREGWTVVEVFSDLALSGATRNRPGLNALLEQASDFDVVIAESIDRISRDQEDIAAIWKRLRFAGARLFTLSEGEVGEIHVGLNGTMAALYLKQVGEKTRRGQMGRVEAGRIPGGLSYGYALVPSFDASGRPDRGQRTIKEDEAAIVRRIFREYLDGRSPKQIAEGLNAEGVPAPSGKKWGASTINGNPRRGIGILHNALYNGRIVYNRQRFEKHPETRKRIAKPNPPSEWRTAEAPHLAIVEPEIFAAVVQRNAQLLAVPARKQTRARRLFSGLVRCGSCGSGYTVISGEYWGCSGRREGRGCDNAATITNTELEHRILSALREKMLAPDVVAAFVREYHAVMVADRRERLSGRARLEKQLAKAKRRVERLVEAIADGTAMAEVKEALQAAAAERDRAAAELAEIEAEPVIALHPGLADVYRSKLEHLAEAVRVENPAAAPAREQIRSLVDVIVVSPRAEGRGVELALQGRLAAILSLTQKGRPVAGPALLPNLAIALEVVAGAGFEPATFRL